MNYSNPAMAAKLKAYYEENKKTIIATSKAYRAASREAQAKAAETAIVLNTADDIAQPYTDITEAEIAAWWNDRKKNSGDAK